jgi:hypothetical protein
MREEEWVGRRVNPRQLWHGTKKERKRKGGQGREAYLSYLPSLASIMKL